MGSGPSSGVPDSTAPSAVQVSPGSAPIQRTLAWVVAASGLSSGSCAGNTAMSPGSIWAKIRPLCAA